MGFILDGLETDAYDRTYGDRVLVERIAAYFRPHAGRMALVAAAITLNSLSGTAGPILIGRGIDVLRGGPAPGTETIVVLSAGVLLFGLAAWGFNAVQQWFSAKVIGDVVVKLRDDVFSAVVRHDLSFFEESPSGKIVSRVTSDTQDFSDVVSLTTGLLSQILLVLIMSAWLATINAFLVVLLLGMSPLAVVIALSFRRVARQVTQKARRVTAKINGQIQESISGIIVAKSFRQEDSIYSDFAANNQQAYHVGLRRGLTLDTIFPIMGMTSGAGTALLLFAGGLATGEERWFGLSAVSPGNWYLFMQAVGYYWWPLVSIASFWSQFQDGLAAAERVFALMDAKPRIIQTAHDPVPRLEGSIEFRRLTFGYTSADTVLRDFSLIIRPRETVAVVGHTGAGKSSLANLVARFYEYQSGELLIDGKDIRRLDLDQYRSRLGFVPQEPFLFSGTVRENIRYGMPGADDDQVSRAAGLVSGGSWVADLPAGLHTDVGERGASLSMGQRQLVALARAVLKDPAILILDEATASVDPFTEMQIQEGLDALMKDRTAIVIAHRLSTIRGAGRIIVLCNGAITAEGTHDELMRQGGHYAELYNTYFRHQSLEYVEKRGGAGE